MKTPSEVEITRLIKELTELYPELTNNGKITMITVIEYLKLFRAEKAERAAA